MTQLTTFNYKKNNNQIIDVRYYNNSIYYYSKNSSPIIDKKDYHTHIILWDIDKDDWETLVIDNILSTKKSKNNCLIDSYNSIHSQEMSYIYYAITIKFILFMFFPMTLFT